MASHTGQRVDQRILQRLDSPKSTLLRHLPKEFEKEWPAAYTDGFRAQDSLMDDDCYQQEIVVHSEGEYAEENLDEIAELCRQRKEATERMSRAV